MSAFIFLFDTDTAHYNTENQDINTEADSLIDDLDAIQLVRNSVFTKPKIKQRRST